jgi:hypothetical protein
LQGPFPKKKTILQGLKPKLGIFAGTKNYKKKIAGTKTKT